MPVGSVGKWLVLGTLVAALGASGCKEDDGDEGPADTGTGTPDTGTGSPDTGTGGGNDAGAGDSGTGPADSGTMQDANVMCGTLSCSPHTIMLSGAVVAPGCTKNAFDAGVCGISTSTLGGVDAGLPEFLEKGAPGVASTDCAEYIDLLEPVPDGGAADGGPRGNKLVDVTTNNFPISYPGCCTADGFCSADTNKGKLMGTLDVSGGYGCMTPAVFLARFLTDLPSRFVPCDPDSGMILPRGDGGTDGGTSDGGSDSGN